VKRFDDDSFKTRAKALFAELKAVSGAVTPTSRQNVLRTNDEQATRVDCNGAYRLPLDRPITHSALILVSS
jgi:hypothetical protein